MFRIEPRSGTVVKHDRRRQRPGRRGRRGRGGVDREPPGRDRLARRPGDRRGHRHRQGATRSERDRGRRRRSVGGERDRRDRLADRPRDAANGRDDRGEEQSERDRRRGRQGVDGGARRAGDPSRRNTAGARRTRSATTASSPPASTTSRPTHCSRSPTTASSPTGAPAARRSDRSSALSPPTSRARAPTGGPTSSSCARSCATPTARPSARRTSAPRSKPCSAAIPGWRRPTTGIVGGQRCARRPASCDLSAGIVTDARLRTITVHLTRPDGEFLHGLAVALAFVAPAAHPFGRTQPPGTGPYRIVSYDRNRGARLVRNPHFRAWSPGARPDGFADEIVVRVNPDRDAQVAAVQRGEADVVHVVGPFGGACAGQPAGARDRATPDSSTPMPSPNWTSCSSTCARPRSTTRGSGARSTTPSTGARSPGSPAVPTSPNPPASCCRPASRTTGRRVPTRCTRAPAAAGARPTSNGRGA